MAKKIIAVELVKLEYADVPKAGLPSSWTELENVHEETFKYIEGEPTTDPYKDVKGRTYYNEVKEGDKHIIATIGRYDLETKAKLQGGTYTAANASSGAIWTPPDTPEVIYKAVKGTTKDNVSIIFPKAQVIANATENKKAIGQGVKFVPVTPDDPDLKSEIWNDNEKTA